jgi:hypothetical protein
VADEQKGISAEIIAANKLILQELILLWIERPRESSRETWNIRPPDQIGQYRKPLGPSQFVEDAAQSDEEVDVRGCRKWRRLRAEMRHPTEDVRIAPQLIERIHFGVVGAEIT